MFKISKAIEEIVEKNPVLTFVFHHKLINLTKTAEFIKPLIEARTKKEIKSSAILMCLSRYQKRYEKIKVSRENYKIENINVRSDLSTITFTLEDKVLNQINDLYNKLHMEGAYIVISRGTREITLILNSEFLEMVENHVGAVPKYKKSGIAAIGINFEEKYAEIPGLLYAVMQQIRLQNINIVEVISTYTELIIYVEKDQAKLSFDTIFQSFS